MADTSLVAVGTAVSALSLVFGWVAFKVQREHRAWCASKTKANGVVSRLVGRRRTGLSEDGAGMPNDAAVAMVPVVRFRAGNGLEYEIDAPDAQAEVGSAVEVAYEPALPSGARAVVRYPKIGLVLVLLVVGLGLVVAGLSR